MKLKYNGIEDIDSWGKIAPPMDKEKQWVSGRSAMELARYMTSDLPKVPKDIEKILLKFVDSSAEFEWAAEYITRFEPFGLGRGNGRNHDAFMFNDDIVVGIEGKADEPLGSQLIGEAIQSASDNKLQRINGMIQMLFGDMPDKHKNIRYQLVTAATATLLEATKKNVKKALLLVIVFKKPGCYSDEKIHRNNDDINAFLSDISAKKKDDYYFIPTMYGKEMGIDLFFKKIEIDL